MRPKIRTVVVILAALLVGGCATVLETKEYKTYRVGSTVTANVGMPFLKDQQGEIKKVKRWVGLLYSPNGWQIDEVHSPDFVMKELVYSGKSGSTIEIGYREYRGGMAAPAFYQSVKYDMTESTLIGFQNFKFEVLSASNSSITVNIISD